MLHLVVRLRDRRRRERVRADQGRPALDQVLLVDVLDDLGLRDRQQVVVALDEHVEVLEPLRAERLLLELVLLDHRAHGAVVHGDARLEQLRDVGAGRVAPPDVVGKAPRVQIVRLRPRRPQVGELRRLDGRPLRARGRDARIRQRIVHVRVRRVLLRRLAHRQRRLRLLLRDVVLLPVEHDARLLLVEARSTRRRSLILLRLLAVEEPLAHLRQLVGGLVRAVQHGVCAHLAEVFLQVPERQHLPRVDDAHVHAGLDRGLGEEHGMNRLSDDLGASEAEAEVRDAPRDLAPGADLLDGPAGLDEVHAVVVVLREARADRQNIRVEDDVLRGEADRRVHQDVVAPLADADLVLLRRRLAELVERHDDDRRAVLA